MSMGFDTNSEIVKFRKLTDTTWATANTQRGSTASIVFTPPGTFTLTISPTAEVTVHSTLRKAKAYYSKYLRTLPV